jgi:dienelactone hydrolase
MASFGGRAVIVVLALALGGVSACVGGSGASSAGSAPSDGGRGSAVMRVDPPSSTTDAPVSITMSGLPAGAEATVEAWTTDARSRKWTSQARFTVGDDGRLSLAQPSEGGSYTGADPMGLLESLDIDDPDPYGEFRVLAHTYAVNVRVSVGGRVRASAVVRREVVAPGVSVKKLTVEDDGVYGELYRPAVSTVARPAILMFGGSEGGLSMSTTAAALAARGYPALSLAYFAAPGVPRRLDRIPLEYFGRALAILRAQKGVDRDRIVVMGDSRGGEAALLLGAYYPDRVHAVVAGVPSSVALPGLTPRYRPAWTWHGRAVPTYTSYRGVVPPIDATGAIPVERIRGPILMVCGGNDLLWSSCAFVEAVRARLRAHGFTHPVTALTYPDAGHFVGVIMAYIPCSTACFVALGGTAQVNHAATRDSQAKLMAMLASL